MPNPRKILLVEDEPELIHIFGAVLKQSGFEVEIVMDGESALKKVKSFQPDLVLLDLVIPEIDGYEVLSRIKKDKKTKDILVYVWSNLAQNGEIKKAEKLGADGYLIKTDYVPTKLVERVKEILA
ncbi:MAG: response regulator [Patescibacteria group bacterium]